MNVHGKFGYREPESSITQEYIAKEAKKIKAGDRITWTIPVMDRNSLTLARTPKKRRLTVTWKTRYLIIAEDKEGMVHTIRLAEWAAEKWKKDHK